MVWEGGKDAWNVYDGRDPPEHQAWILARVRRDTRTHGHLTRIALQLGWFKEGPRITAQNDHWITDWSRSDQERPPDPLVSAQVRVSYDSCPAKAHFPQRALLRDAQGRCDAAASAEHTDACWLVARAYLLGECGVTRDLERGLQYARLDSSDGWPGKKARYVAWRLHEQGRPDDIRAALRMLGCLPDSSKAQGELCAGLLIANRLLWASGNPAWMNMALDNLDRSCPNAETADPCGSDDETCSTAIEFLESGRARAPQLDRIARYRHTLAHRPRSPGDECW